MFAIMLHKLNHFPLYKNLETTDAQHSNKDFCKYRIAKNHNAAANVSGSHKYDLMSSCTHEHPASDVPFFFILNNA